jgi:hypothetical protein
VNDTGSPEPLVKKNCHFLCFINATFNNISVISIMAVCFIGGVNRENHHPATIFCQSLSHNVVLGKKCFYLLIFTKVQLHININNIPPLEPQGIEIGPSFSTEGYNTPKENRLGV